MSKMYYDEDANLELLSGKKVAIIGYGSQGHAHALNLRDSGVDVCVGLYKGSKSWAIAEKAGLQVMDAYDAAKEADFIMMLVPDEKQGKIYKESIEPNLTAGKALIFAHGFQYTLWTNSTTSRCRCIYDSTKGTRTYCKKSI